MLIVFLVSCLPAAHAQSTAFTYQGRLNSGAGPANGLYDFQFTIYDNSAGPGSAVTETNTISGVVVSNGLFTVTPDFINSDLMSLFNGQELWLGIAVRTNGPGNTGYTALLPRLMFTPTPYAIHSFNTEVANKANSVANGSITAASIAPGAIGAGQVASNSITASQLAPGAAAANLGSNGVSGVPSTGIVLSQREINPSLLKAGLVPVGSSFTLAGEAWTVLPPGPLATGVLNPGRYSHKAVWTGTEMLIIGGTPNSIGLRYNPAANTWSVMNKSNAPTIGAYVQAAWTGTQLIVWDAKLGVGGRYTPGTDTWQPMSSAGGPSAREGESAAFANGFFVVWGGHNPGNEAAQLNTGARYSPSTDIWTATSLSNVPQPRSSAAAVAEGSEIIFVGGHPAFDVDNGIFPSGLASGARYNPAANTWIPIADSPGGGDLPVGTWSGTDLFLTGGFTYQTVNLLGGGTGVWFIPNPQGKKYHLATDTWTLMSTNGSPAGITDHVAVWSGANLIIWGGYSFHFNDFVGYMPSPTSTGARYIPGSDTWVPLATNGAAPRADHAAVWTGSQMLFWGGQDGSYAQLGDGLRYTLASDSWSNMAVPPASGEPGERSQATAIWTGKSLVVWGGINNSTTLRTGGIYTPGTGWTNTPDSGAPSGRYRHTAVWTGSEMIIWGGLSGLAGPVNTGARFNVSSNRWFPVSTVNAPQARADHTAIWTGTEMLVWGGYDYTNILYPAALRTGGAYNPVTDTWRPLATGFFLFSRSGHSAVWTGSKMIIWGGSSTTGGFSPTVTYYSDGYLYTPASDTWVNLPVSGLAGRRFHTAVWSGDDMIVWGGQTSAGATSSGARYNPGNNTWTAVQTSNVPSSRYNHTAVWADAIGQMIVWGGTTGGSDLNTGGLFDPLQNKWTTTTNGPFAPSARTDHVAGWTGGDMLVFNGVFLGTNYLNEGYSYTPVTRFYLYRKP